MFPLGAQCSSSEYDTGGARLLTPSASARHPPSKIRDLQLLWVLGRARWQVTLGHGKRIERMMLVRERPLRHQIEPHSGRWHLILRAPVLCLTDEFLGHA